MSISHRGSASRSWTIWLLVTCFATIYFSGQRAALSDGIPASFNTQSGVVEVRPEAGPACGSTSYDTQCSVLFINRKRIAGDYQLSISAVLPSVQHPALIGVDTSTGGNACCWESYLIDVSTSHAYTFSGYSLDAKARIIGRDAFFDTYSGQDKLGDQLLTNYRYRIGSGIKPSIIKSRPQFNNKPLGSGPYAFDILSNPRLRAPLLRLIGEDKFAEYRQSLGVSGPIKIIDNQYVVGSGCMAHACTSEFGLFVIDMKNDLAWAMMGDYDYRQPATARRWGILTPEDFVPRTAITKWEVENQIEPNAVTDVPLNEKTISFYLRPQPKHASTKTCRDQISSCPDTF